MKELDNIICISGKIAKDFQHSHKNYYTSIVHVERENGKIDMIPIMFDIRIMEGITVGTYVSISGQIHHERKRKEEWKHYVFVNHINIIENEQYEQMAYLSGTVYQKFEINGKIKKLEFILNMERGYKGITDHITVYVLDKQYKMMVDVCIGDKIEMIGKLQSKQFVEKGTGKLRNAINVKLQHAQKI